MADPQPTGQFSPDGRWWWDGRQWLPALSPDGRFYWDGQGWVPTDANATRAVPQSSSAFTARLPGKRLRIGGGVVLGLVAIGLALTAWFNRPSAPPRPTAPQLVTPREAAAEATKFWQSFQVAAARGDYATLLSRTTGPEYDTLNGQLHGSPVPVVRPLPTGWVVPAFAVTAVAVPRQAVYPIWFAAVGKTSGGGPITQVFTRSSPKSDWKLELITVDLALPTPGNDGFIAGPMRPNEEGSLRMSATEVTQGYLSLLQHSTPTTKALGPFAGGGILSPLNESSWTTTPAATVTTQFALHPDGILFESRVADGELVVFVINGQHTYQVPGSCLSRGANRQSHLWDALPDGRTRSLTYHTRIVAEAIIPPRAGGKPVQLHQHYDVVWIEVSAC